MKTQVQNQMIEVQSPWLVIESNHGNHSGYNRTWKIWNEYYATKAEACRDMAEWLNDKNDARPGQHGYTRMTEASGEHDLRYVHVVKWSELADFFNGCGNDVTSQPMVQLIEEDAAA